MTDASHIGTYLQETSQILAKLSVEAIEQVIRLLVSLKTRRGRLFVLGVGGSASNASHAVNDFRKIAGIEAYAPTDNVAELTARVNDDGWDSVFVNWLKISRLGSEDMLLVLSVGGGDPERGISPNLVHASRYAREVGARICGIVGRDGGYTARVADACLIIPTVNAATVTPHVEEFQSVICHLLISHPALRTTPTKWESLCSR